MKLKLIAVAMFLAIAVVALWLFWLLFFYGAATVLNEAESKVWPDTLTTDSLSGELPNARLVELTDSLAWEE